MARESDDMTVNQAGHKGGEKVRELIQKGKETESREGSQAAAGDPVSIIKNDHRAVESLFSKFEGSSDAEAERIAGTICNELLLHTTMEEKFFYPIVRRETAKQGKELVQDGIAEHKAVKELIARLQKLDANDPEFAEVVVLIQKNVEHHIEEEEKEMLPLANECIEDELLDEIGGQMMDYKEQAKGTIH